MDNYTNRRQRENFALLNMAINEIDAMAQDKLFKPGLANLRRGKAFVLKGLKEIGDTLAIDERKRFDNLERICTVQIIEKTKVTNDMIRVSQEALYNIAEIAIGKECIGCEKHDWKGCQLRKNLSDAWVPPVRDNSRTECQYKQ